MSTVTLEDHMPKNPIEELGIEFAIVDAARTCTGIDPCTRDIKRDKGLIRYLYKNRHTTPFEMIQFKFRIRTTRAIALQICRHRTLSINMESQRYSEVQEGEFMQIDQLRSQDKKRKQCSSPTLIDDPILLKRINEHCNASYTLYKDLVDSGVAREQARFILPENTLTTLVISVNLHNLLHFIRLRSAPDAQLEIREISDEMFRLITPLCPNVAQFLSEESANSSDKK